MKLYNTLSRQAEDFKPLDDTQVTMYSCGPTVYDHIHIGNLSAFITADTLRRTLQASGHTVKHVMNFTDVDDKTIHRSVQRYPDISREEALQKLTGEYEAVFLSDMQAIGNDTARITFIRATDSFDAMRSLIGRLHTDGFAYIADDGVYFSIEKYQASGKKYGQLLELTAASTSDARINNDEYDKESVHDFALWKIRKDDEPAWEFTLDGHELLGRPGWHIECSAMSVGHLGQPFDIHTGGVDLIFPHHENEIAQSTAGQDNVSYARYFIHNEHLLVDGKKMSKSVGNFFTLRDIQEKGYDPLAFRLLVLQSHYRSQTNFNWENLEAAQNRLRQLQAMADMRWQVREHPATASPTPYNAYTTSLLTSMQDDLNTPMALASLSSLTQDINEAVASSTKDAFLALLKTIDDCFGLQLLASSDIDEPTKAVLQARQQAREAKDWDKSDTLRHQLTAQGIGVRDTDNGQIWYRL